MGKISIAVFLYLYGQRTAKTSMLHLSSFTQSIISNRRALLLGNMNYHNINKYSEYSE